MGNQFKSKLLAIVALASIIFYSINCRPAWNPESNKVAYIYYDESMWGITIYDLITKENKFIVEVSQNESSNKGEIFVPIEVFWLKNGKDLIYVLAPGEHDSKTGILVLYKYNLIKNEEEKIDSFNIPGVSTSSSGNIILERERWLWIAGEDGYYRIDIKKGKTQKFKQKEEIVFGNDRKLYFASQSEKDKIPIGKINTLFGIKGKKLFTIFQENGQKITLLLSTPLKQKRFAFLKYTEKETKIVLINEKGKYIKEINLPESIKIEAGSDDSLSFSSEWNQQGTILWFTIRTENDKFAVAEVNFVEESVNIIKFDDIIYETKEKIVPFPFQFALSSDQKHLAMSLMSEDYKSFRLGLIDLTTKERKITIIPPIEDKLKETQNKD